jgi:DNA-binding XRE family transcriptional regulator
MKKNTLSFNKMSEAGHYLFTEALKQHTKSSLSEHLGVSRPTLLQFENKCISGDETVNYELIDKIKKMLKIELKINILKHGKV